MTRTLRRSLEGCTLRPSLRLCLFEDGYSLDLLGFLIPLNFLKRWHRLPECMMESWGPYYDHNSFVWTWGDRYKFFRMPWDWEHQKTEVMKPDGTWAKKHYSFETPDGRWEATYPYTYTLKNGTVQRRNANIHVERMEWRRRWLQWTPVLAMVKQSIWVEFDGEVGERSGSWKGGVIGTGCDMRPGETPEQALKRMEKERVFR